MEKWRVVHFFLERPLREKQATPSWQQKNEPVDSRAASNLVSIESSGVCRRWIWSLPSPTKKKKKKSSSLVGGYVPHYKMPFVQATASTREGFFFFPSPSLRQSSPDASNKIALNNKIPSRRASKILY